MPDVGADGKYAQVLLVLGVLVRLGLLLPFATILAEKSMFDKTVNNFLPALVNVTLYLHCISNPIIFIYTEYFAQ